jgi:AcrR family transcriptional regulator
MVQLTPTRKGRTPVVLPPSAKSRAFKQRRSKITHDALIKAGFELVDKYDIDAISIAELARHAGYSVGGFYAIFASKDEFFDALIESHLDKRTTTHKALLQKSSRVRLIDELLANIVRYYWEHHVFWRAVLRRTLLDPAYWAPFRIHFKESTQRFEARIEAELQRRLTAKEKNNISFAFQMVMGTINISILNQPGPVLIGERLFTKELTRAFKLLSGVEALLAAGPARATKKK